MASENDETGAANSPDRQTAPTSGRKVHKILWDRFRFYWETQKHAVQHRAGSLWEAAKHTISNLLRYAVIAFLFLYLLTAVVLFHDIMAFHDRVADDVGDDARARRVVLMLHEMEQNPEIYPRASTDLPEGTLAVALGAIQASHAELSKFERFVRAPEKAAEGEEQENPKRLTAEEKAKADIEKFEALRESIGEQADAFKELLTENVPDAAILIAIKDFREKMEASSAKHDEAKASAKDRLVSLEKNVADFQAAVRKADDYIPAYRLQQSIRERLDRLNIRTIDENSVETAMGSLEQEVQSFAAGLAKLDNAVKSYLGKETTAEQPEKESNGTSDGDLTAMKATGAKSDGVMMASLGRAAGSTTSSSPTLEDKLQAFHGSVIEHEESVVPFKHLAGIHRQLLDLTPESIEPIVFAGEMDALKNDIQSFKGKINRLPNISKTSETLANYIAVIDDALVKPITPASIEAALPGIKDMKTGFDDIADALAFDRLTPKLFHALSAMGREIERTRLAVETVEPGAQVEQPNFEPQLAHIQEALEKRYSGGYFAGALSLVNNVADLRSRLASLETITPEKHPDAHSNPQKAPQELFDEEMQAMGKKLNTVEERLKEQGRVVALANVLREDENESADSAGIKADGIIQNYDALQRFGWIMLPFSTLVSPTSVWASFGFDPLKLATLTTDSITTIYVFLVGAIGSLIYITKYQLKLVIDGHRIHTRPPRSLPWFLFRPFFGIVVALALYFMVRAGQMAFGSGEDGGVGTTLNIPILSVLALFAGILSWDALRTIETRGQSWFRSQARQPLWATGLGNALRTRGITETECSERIGRSEEQLERWLKFKDQVSIEMQDRIQTWLGVSGDELFGEDKPNEDITGKALWAVGLRAALDSPGTRLDAESLVLLLREEKREDNIKRIEDWIALKKQVPPATQWRLVDLLDVAHSRLFSPDLGNIPVWGLELRRVIEDRMENAQKIADHLALPVQNVHDWKELEKPIPPAMQEPLMACLGCTFSQLFETGDLSHHKDLFLKANNLARALKEKGIDEKDFALDVDVEPERVESWIEGEAIARPTRLTIIRVLGGDSPDLFLPPRITDQRDGETDAGAAGGRRSPAFATGLAKAMEKEGVKDARALAEKLHGSAVTPAKVSRAQSWIDQRTKVSWQMQQRLIILLKTTWKALFGQP